MLAFKPFLRISILSIILTFLMIYLGVKYHWGDHFKKTSPISMELDIPAQNDAANNNRVVSNNDANSFDPKIVQGSSASSLIDSMNKEQINEYCINLLSKELKDTLSLELASVNCVLSNFQETFQNSNVQNNHNEVEIQNKKSLFKQECDQELTQSKKYTAIEKQLLIGICVSDRLNSVQ